MIPFLAKCGEKTVFHAGIAALGYPGTWATRKSEISKMEEYLFLALIRIVSFYLWGCALAYITEYDFNLGAILDIMNVDRTRSCWCFQGFDTISERSLLCWLK